MTSHRRERGRGRRLRATLTVVAVAALVAVGPGVATAEEQGRVEDAVREGREGLQQWVGQQRQSTPTAPGAEEQTAEGEDAVRQGESRAKGQVAELDVAGEDVVDVGRSEASTDRDDRAQSDATLLSVGGEEVMGAHADSDGEKESHAGNPFGAICEASGGQLCLSFLFADAYADEDADSSDAQSRSGAADVCLGGDSTDPKEGCSGQARVGALTSKAHTHRDKRTGSSESSGESALADVCLEPGEDGSCAVGVGLMKARSEASSDGKTKGESSIVELQGGGEKYSFSDPQELEIPPGCPEPSLVCGAVNEGASSVKDGIARQTQDALNAVVLPGVLDIDLGLSRTEAVASAGDRVAGAERQRPSGSAEGGYTDEPDAGGILPNTGGVRSGLLAAALAAVAAGSYLLARRRRKDALA